MARKLLMSALLCGSLWISAGVALGQDPAAPAATEGAQPSSHGKSWWDLFKTTGPVGVLLLLTSVIGTGLLIQYLRTITEPNLCSPEMMEEVEGYLTEGNFDDAIARLETDQSYAGKVLLGALSRSSSGYDESQKAMEETAAVEAFRLNASISYLSLVGNIGPLLGLLGTVTGMISSFQEIERLKSPTPGDLAKGVYESLVNTTIGLFIAIVFLTAYFFMKNKLSDITLRVNNQVNELLSRTIGATANE